MTRRADFRTLGGASYQEIGAELGVTVQAVQQIERRALRKLRIALESVGFDPDDYMRESEPESHWERIQEGR